MVMIRQDPWLMYQRRRIANPDGLALESSQPRAALAMARDIRFRSAGWLTNRDVGTSRRHRRRFEMSRRREPCASHDMRCRGLATALARQPIESVRSSGARRCPSHRATRHEQQTSFEC
jgi:hypothetical protein